MIVKVCGMREPDNIRAVEQTGPDWMGFIFFPHSSRHVSHPPSYKKRKNSTFIISNCTEQKLPNNVST